MSMDRVRWKRRVRATSRGQARACVRRDQFAVGAPVHFDEQYDHVSALEYILAALGADLVNGFHLLACKRWVSADHIEAVESGELNHSMRAGAMHADLQVLDRAAATRKAIKRCDAAFSRHHVDAIMAAMTDDCVLESTYPPPDGRRFEGQEAVRDGWEELFRSSPDASSETEELFVVDDRCTAR